MFQKIINPKEEITVFAVTELNRSTEHISKREKATKTAAENSSERVIATDATLLVHLSVGFVKPTEVETRESH